MWRRVHRCAHGHVYRHVYMHMHGHVHRYWLGTTYPSRSRFREVGAHQFWCSLESGLRSMWPGHAVGGITRLQPVSRWVLVYRRRSMWVSAYRRRSMRVSAYRRRSMRVLTYRRRYWDDVGNHVHARCIAIRSRRLYGCMRMQKGAALTKGPRGPLTTATHPVPPPPGSPEEVSRI